MAGIGLYLAVGSPDSRVVRLVGRRTPLFRTWRESHRSEGRSVRGGVEGRVEAGAVQAVRQGVHSRPAGRRADGVVGRLLRGVLQLRASQAPGADEFVTDGVKGSHIKDGERSHQNPVPGSAG